VRADDQALLEYAKGLTPEDMPSSDLRWIAGTIGVEAAVKLTIEHCGLRIHLPRRLVFMLKQRCVQKLFNGLNTRELATQLGVCETTIRKWTSTGTSAPAPDLRQTSLFEHPEKAA
jgi:hypothetical protein